MEKKVKAGDLIKIPFKKGWYTYGRVLIDNSYAIYDCPSEQLITDYNTILSSDILFITHVDNFAVGEGHWKVIKNILLESTLQHFYPLYFNPNPADSTKLGFYKVYRDEIEEAIKKDWIKTGKIQLDGISGHMHVEARINDYYDRKRNKSNEQRITLFKRMNSLL